MHSRNKYAKQFNGKDEPRLGRRPEGREMGKAITIIEHWLWQENSEEQKLGEMRCLSLVTDGGILCRYWGDKNPPEAEDIEKLPALVKRIESLESQVRELERERDRLSEAGENLHAKMREVDSERNSLEVEAKRNYEIINGQTEEIAHLRECLKEIAGLTSYGVPVQSTWILVHEIAMKAIKEGE